jgi:LCP family protein required for cell wall assembly
VVLVLVAVTGFVLVYYQTLASQLEGAINVQAIDPLVEKLPSQEETPPPTDGAAGRAINILVLGSDIRTGRNGQIGGRLSGPNSMRSDTAMVMHVSADRTRIDVVSIPRDTIVTVPTCTFHDGDTKEGWTGKFNIAFANGGSRGDPSEAAACVQHTIQQLWGVPIDHYVVVDFVGFINMIDAVGGVPMCIPERVVSSKSKLDLQPGAQLLDGETALAFARLRTAEQGDVSGSDIQRIDRQQELLYQLARTAMAKNLLTDVGELTQLIRAGAESLTMDPTLGSVDYMLGLAFSLRNLDTDNITFTTIPWEYERPAYDVIIRPEADQMWDDLINDRPLSVLGDEDEWDNGRDESTSTAGPQASPTTPAATDTETPEPDRKSVDELLAECTV